jgi:hypothetical protein
VSQPARASTNSLDPLPITLRLPIHSQLAKATEVPRQVRFIPNPVLNACSSPRVICHWGRSWLPNGFRLWRRRGPRPVERSGWCQGPRLTKDGVNIRGDR